MHIIEPSFEILDFTDPIMLKGKIELYGRVCYKSESKITSDSSTAFIKKLIKSGHESVIEHEKITIRVICDRGVSHEIVRHRIASYSQESTRYCNYAKEKYGNELTFIKPFFWKEDSKQYILWKESMQLIERNYLELIKLGSAPEEARSILPNSLKTEIIITMNLREWRHFFSLRTSKSAHPQMRQLSIPILLEFNSRLPILFEDIIQENNISVNNKI